MDSSAIEASATTSDTRMRRNWDGWAAIIAALIGVLALFVSSYTAYIQRQQVRAQVWPYLLIGNADQSRAIIVWNKGVGPAMVRHVQVRVDGKAQPDWTGVFTALGLPHAGDDFEQSTLNRNVLAPGEKLEVLVLRDAGLYTRFRREAARLQMDVCFCSTLGDCWLRADGRSNDGQKALPVSSCPVAKRGDEFMN